MRERRRRIKTAERASSEYGETKGQREIRLRVGSAHAFAIYPKNHRVTLKGSKLKETIRHLLECIPKT